MSGIVGSKLNIRGSGRIAKLGTDGQALTSAGAGGSAVYEDVAAGISWQTIVTASTMTAVAGNGYWIDTSSNTCTITLPSSASAGDTIIFADYARYWGTNGIELDSNGLNYQGQDDEYTVEYGTDGLALRIVYMNSTKGWIPNLDKTVEDVPSLGNDNGLMAYGNTGSGNTAVSNIISNVGVVASDVTGVGTARTSVSACEYGDDKGIFAYGLVSGYVSMSNLVTNAGVIGSDVTGVGTARDSMAAATYGGDKGIFGYGSVGPASMTNLVSNSGVIGSDVTGVGTARQYLAACEYSAGQDKAIFAYGQVGGDQSMSNLVTNVGVVGTDVTGVGTGRYGAGACNYGGDKGIFGFGATGSDSAVSMTNLVTNVGVVGDDVTGVGTARYYSGATQYGGDKSIFAYGTTGSDVSLSNLVSNSGVVASDVTGVGTARDDLGACSFN